MSERLIFSELDSSNAEALRYIAKGGAVPAWIITLSQTAGRGRQGRSWIGERNNFFASWIGAPDLEIRDFPLMSFAAALALFDVLSKLGLSSQAAMKWPNDVLLNGCKAAGILLEASGTKLVVGVGVNLCAAPSQNAVPDQNIPPIALADILDSVPEPISFLDMLEDAFETWRGMLERKGFAPLQAAWMERTVHKVDTPILVRNGSSRQAGIFKGISENGHLLLETEAGIEKISAGDIFIDEGNYAPGN